MQEEEEEEKEPPIELQIIISCPQDVHEDKYLKKNKTLFAELVISAYYRLDQAIKTTNLNHNRLFTCVCHVIPTMRLNWRADAG